MQQLVPDLTVVQLGGRGLKAVGHAGVGIYANVGFPLPGSGLLANHERRAEIPVVALLRGRHLRVARARFVLRRGRRIDDGRIDQGARAQADALFSQMRVDVRKDRLGQPLPLE